MNELMLTGRFRPPTGRAGSGSDRRPYAPIGRNGTPPRATAGRNGTPPRDLRQPMAAVGKPEAKA